jgi:hypothetical protein
MLRHAVYLLRYHDFTDYERYDFESHRHAQQPLVILRYLLDKIKIALNVAPVSAMDAFPQSLVLQYRLGLLSIAVCCYHIL